MTTQAEVDPYAPAPPASDAPPAPGRSLASGIAVFLGGYLLLLALISPLVGALAGFTGSGPGYTALLLLQLGFALLVVIGGFWIAPAAAGRKVAASVLVLVVTVLVLVVSVARISGSLRLGQLPTFTFANPWFMAVLAVGAGWLIVRSARAGWLAVLLALVLSPLPFAFAIAGLDTAITQILMLTATLVAGLGILLAGRPGRG